MIKIVIAQGESVRIETADSDGGFDIAYTDSELTIKADIGGSHKGDEGVIYREVFAGCSCFVDNQGTRYTDERCSTHGEVGWSKKIANTDAAES